jgi:hypothetical protein
MLVERSRWFRVVVTSLALVSVWFLSAMAGVWPHGPRNIAAVVVVFFCLLGLDRLYAGLLGMIAVLVEKPAGPAG